MTPPQKKDTNIKIRKWLHIKAHPYEEDYSATLKSEFDLSLLPLRDVHDDL